MSLLCLLRYRVIVLVFCVNSSTLLLVIVLFPWCCWAPPKHMVAFMS